MTCIVFMIHIHMYNRMDLSERLKQLLRLFIVTYYH